jgi:hypothetical protein
VVAIMMLCAEKRSIDGVSPIYRVACRRLARFVESAKHKPFEAHSRVGPDAATSIRQGTQLTVTIQMPRFHCLRQRGEVILDLIGVNSDSQEEIAIPVRNLMFGVSQQI